ncbi:FtsQ-type POTRA domain-containing protein [Gordonia sp. LSe1-13]|uniref:FtsQ-type POTRA domain-containing protein n=1 Tax=Gordonia sesuvii TaxID=3116777 RepID=A0ABU7MIK3_9ACTN|nr:FtsQ-type POTRA domain-containing protein [Gordonia sp. LSe1-13]
MTGRGRERGGRLRPRRPRLLLGTLAVIVVVAGLAAIAYFTPLMAVRSTDVQSNEAVPADQIIGAARVADGTPLLQVDTQAVAQRIAAIPSIESVRVQRSYPSALTITVVERQPVVKVTDGDKVHVLDRSGVGYLTFDTSTGVPPEINGLPEFSTPNPGPSDPTTVETLGAVSELPESISGRLIAVSASSPVDIEFTLEGDKTVVWGDSERGAEKARTLDALLTRPASTYNVSSPEFPAFS